MNKKKRSGDFPLRFLLMFYVQLFAIADVAMSTS